MTPTVHTVVFAKAPRPGRVKTRLIPALGPAGAAELAARLLAHALAQALRADLGPVELCRSPDDDRAWGAVELPPGLILSGQGDGDLGARLARAAGRVIAGGRPALLMGTDCPALTADRLHAMARALGDADAAITPVADGGYAALGFNHCHPDLFRDVPWSTPTVCQVTAARLSALGWSLHHCPTLHDIDEPGDLRHLPPDWPEYRP
ncbi:TIGR04282 family arsenosugar biosynthesis glycosyltransferase [Alkalilimnicola ehrlichii MLHE-1]|uniref:Glycosyltransferase n=1 Tax=Alkalilimnicola ehrlichii (strain ATCC BAA-1101 / DSM 17681 / MLHE-1) TaxID=187272 RepID=Q0AAM9_ALKEH|nr:TIGR04282 family arsenosugar biosynthesis glycosyltransferase [Alkalilimnicola ehrlichii]ABI56108.1 conserved hypothetical protein [Alkalilimnicola ehrlichii MLHE-1]